MDTLAPGSRCRRAAGASATVVVWLVGAPLALVLAATMLLPTELGGAIGYLLPYALIVAAPFVVAALVVALAVALGGAQARALPGRGAWALGGLSSLVGVATVVTTVALMWLALRLPA